jgi:CBS domain-containing protein
MKEAITCQASMPVGDAARILRVNRISGMPVLDGDRLVGVISESDLLKILSVEEEGGELWLPSPFEIIEVPLRSIIRWEKLKASLSSLEDMRVSDVMTASIHSIAPDASLEEAAKMMTEHHINRLPVVFEGSVIGIITRGDIIAGLAANASMEKEKVEADQPLQGEQVKE